MCLVVNVPETEAMYSKTDTVTVWKIYKVCGGDLFSPMQSNNRSIDTHIVSDRVEQAFRHNAGDRRYGSEYRVEHGIHVFMTRKATRTYKKQLEQSRHYRDDNYIIVRCNADMKQFVAIGTTLYSTEFCSVKSAVFMAIYISPENKKKALKGDFR